jgi:hypothetical protein
VTTRYHLSVHAADSAGAILLGASRYVVCMTLLVLPSVMIVFS